MGMDWDRTQRETKAAADRDPSMPGAVVLESWIEGSKKPKRARPYRSVAAAVEAAWREPSATLDGTGVLSLATTGAYGPYVLKQRIRAHGAYLSAASWREMKTRQS